MAMKKKPKRRTRGPGRLSASQRAPTDRQTDFLAAVRTLTRSLGRAPNAQEIGDHLGISRLGARLRLKHLEQTGYLKDVPKTVSSGKWALTPAGASALDED